MEDRAEALQIGAGQFEKSAGALKNKMCMKNLKATIMMVVGVLILLLIVYSLFIITKSINQSIDQSIN